MENLNLMDEEIESLIKTLKNTDHGTDKYEKVEKQLGELFEMRLSAEKVVNSFEIERSKVEVSKEKNSNERDDNEAQRKQTSKEAWLKFGTDAAGIILPLVGYGLMYAVGLNFEETGAISSTFVRNLVGKIRPTR